MHPNFPEPEWLAAIDVTPGPPLELTKARRKTLSSTGHLIDRLAATCDHLLAKVSEDFKPELQPWLLSMANMGPCSLHGEGLIVCPLQMNGEKFQLFPSILSAAHVARAVNLWRLSHPDVPEDLPPPLSMADASVNSPLWPALLRLRVLREFWERELRRSTMENLLEILPKAWLLDQASLPPGAVIPGLELASWSSLTSLRNTQRRFVISSVNGEKPPVTLDDSMPEDQWRQTLNAAIQAAASNPKILLELTPSSSDSKLLLSYYRKTAARVDWLGAVALTNNGAQHHCHRME